ncbi:LysM peptidoglycan-binding domain-containing M23 family metallopeptidase [Streptomyces sp. H27-C3]|uniref:M23 family metallopeptidase n=1 Tax=Streptomyces sp. H27-C3 TaxID=3046305 RepID=UPI0024B8C307|nr:LysM peptidoglycan-binding domain-containing M23 family metallopeptidase [Streptomyces sp. H27-C3]MDJ0465685.1 LysM peptidoglycan-binding domain-containing M23 family metallopeptidase [Streptomyces sp. H27-C3]
MPAKGKHRRPRSNSITRGFVAAGTGGAALALPFIAATGANAAENAAPATAPAVAPEKAAPAAAVTQISHQRKQQPKKAGSKTYAVVSGDYLSKIADQQNVRGGWQKLYEDNRSTVGDNPGLIMPGMKLSIGAKAAGSAPSSASQSSAKAAVPAAQPKSSSSQSSSNASRPEKSESAGSASTASSSSGFTAPVSAGVTTSYRASGGSWSSGYHTGVDFSASSGTSVKAVGAGTVVSAGWSGSYGNEVVIKHNDGRYSQYAHLSSLSVSSGQSVTGGTQIGLSGSTGNSTGPHLHFEIRTGPSYGSDIDPLGYLRGHGVSV